MASSLLNDDEDNATRNTQQQQQQQQHQQQQNQKNNNLNASSSNSSCNKMQDNEAKLKKQNLDQRKQELEKLLNEKSWLLQQLQKQETEILNGNIEFLNFNDFIANLALQCKQEQTATNSNAHNTGDCVSTLSGSGGGGGSNTLTSGEEAILRRKPLTSKENYQNLNNNNNLLLRRQSEVSNRSSEYDNYPANDNQSTHSEGGRGGVMLGATQATQQYAAKAALKKRSATVAGTTAQSSTNLQIIRQQHLEQQQQQLLFKQQQQQQQYHHPQQHLFKQHIEQHQVLMPHLQYATQKFYYTTLQPQTIQLANQQQQQQQQQQAPFGRYVQNKQIAQQQTLHHNQNLNTYQQPPPPPPPIQQQQQQQHQQHILLTSPSAVSGLTIDNISLYSLNSNNVATLHRPAQQQQPIIVQCDKYYLSPTSHHISHNDGGGFIKSSQNIKEYISPHNSPLHLNARDKNRAQTSQSNAAAQRGVTPALDVISLAPSYVSMETIDYSTSPVAPSNMRWRSQTNLPPLHNAGVAADLKSQSSDMLNNNQYYNTALNPPPPASSNFLLAQNQNLLPPPNVTQVKPFKPLDDVSLTSYSSETQQKKLKPKQWLESSLDGPVIRQTPVHEEPSCSSTSFLSSSNNNNNKNNNHNHPTRAKLSSQSLNTSRHYSMSAAQTKNQHNQTSSVQANHSKLSQSTSYLNQMDFVNANQANTPTPSISQPYNLELSPQTTAAYKYLAAQQKSQPLRPMPSALYVNTSSSNLAQSATATTPPLAAALSPDIRIESPVNMTIVQPATFQPYKEVTKPFEMSDFYKYSTKFRQKENNNNNNKE